MKSFLGQIGFHYDAGQQQAAVEEKRESKRRTKRERVPPQKTRTLKHAAKQNRKLSTK